MNNSILHSPRKHNIEWYNENIFLERKKISLPQLGCVHSIIVPCFLVDLCMVTKERKRVASSVLYKIKEDIIILQVLIIFSLLLSSITSSNLIFCYYIKNWSIYWQVIFRFIIHCFVNILKQINKQTYKHMQNVLDKIFQLQNLTLSFLFFNFYYYIYIYLQY